MDNRPYTSGPATDSLGAMRLIDCWVDVPGVARLYPWVMPDISDSKSATYADEPGIGRSSPIKTYSHSDSRSISMRWRIVIFDDSSLQEARRHLAVFRSCLYPRDGSSQQMVPYYPPVICRLGCGERYGVGDQKEVCAVLRSCNVAFPTDVACDPDTLLPYRFDLDLAWEAVYATSNLPGRDKILGEFA